MAGYAVGLKGQGRPLEAPLEAQTDGGVAHLDAVIADVADAKVPRAALEYARQCVNPAELLQHVDAQTSIKRGRAYYRMLELAAYTDAVRTACFETTLHLCEAPGNFVDAVLAVSGGAADWNAMSLVTRESPRFYPHLLGSKKPNGHARVVFGERGTGDILSDSNVACVVHEVSGTAGLVTADADAPSPAVVAAEFRIALLVLRKGGTFVVRFDDDGPEVRAALGLGADVFDRVEIRRLATTNPCDSEWYAVLSGYAGGTPTAKRAVAALETAVGHNAPVEWTPLAEADVCRVAQLMARIRHDRARALRQCIGVARHLYRIDVNDRPRTRAHYLSHLTQNSWMLDRAREMVRDFYMRAMPS